MTMLTVPLSMSSTPTMITLVAQARDGNADALSALYARHGQALMSLAYRLTGSRADAEDVLHDVFLGLPEALRGIAPTLASLGLTPRRCWNETGRPRPFGETPSRDFR
jgi:hypothetical protein